MIVVPPWPPLQTKETHHMCLWIDNLFLVYQEEKGSGTAHIAPVLNVWMANREYGENNAGLKALPESPSPEY